MPPNKTTRVVRRIECATAIGLIIATAACDITRVSNPTSLQLPALSNPQGAEVLRAGVLTEFAPAFSQQMLISGVLVDEFTDTPATVGGSLEDRRVIVATNTDYPFAALSKSRVDALNTIPVVEQYAPAPAWHIAELHALLAASEIVFGEDLCSGVPLGAISDGQPVYGSTLTRAQLFAQATTDLDSAGAYTTGSDSIGFLVAVLRGRALLDEGNSAAAATAVAPVPESFVYPLTFNPAANQVSSFFDLIGQSLAYSVSDREGVNGLPFVSAADPRVPTVTVSGPSGPVVIQPNDDSSSAALVLASGVEAQLIGAEAALATGQTSSWAAALNNLRATAITPALPALPADSTTGASASLRLAVMFRERAFWLFATGHRHGDLRRLVRQYGLPVESVFPTGAYQGGPLAYGTAVVFVPSGDEYQASYKGCVDQNP